MYVKIMFRIKRYNDGFVIINSSTQSISCLFSANYVTKLNKYLTMCIANNSCAR